MRKLNKSELKRVYGGESSGDSVESAESTESVDSGDSVESIDSSAD